MAAITTVINNLISTGKTVYDFITDAYDTSTSDMLVGIEASLQAIRRLHSRFSALERNFMNGLQKVSVGDDWRYLRNLASEMDNIRVVNGEYSPASALHGSESDLHKIRNTLRNFHGYMTDGQTLPKAQNLFQGIFYDNHKDKTLTYRFFANMAKMQTRAFEYYKTFVVSLCMRSGKTLNRCMREKRETIGEITRLHETFLNEQKSALKTFFSCARCDQEGTESCTTISEDEFRCLCKTSRNYRFPLYFGDDCQEHSLIVTKATIRFCDKHWAGIGRCTGYVAAFVDLKFGNSNNCNFVFKENEFDLGRTYEKTYEQLGIWSSGLRKCNGSDMLSSFRLENEACDQGCIDYVSVSISHYQSWKNIFCEWSSSEGLWISGGDYTSGFYQFDQKEVPLVCYHNYDTAKEVIYG